MIWTKLKKNKGNKTPQQITIVKKIETKNNRKKNRNENKNNEINIFYHFLLLKLIFLYENSHKLSYNCHSISLTVTLTLYLTNLTSNPI